MSVVYIRSVWPRARLALLAVTGATTVLGVIIGTTWVACSVVDTLLGARDSRTMSDVADDLALEVDAEPDVTVDSLIEPTGVEDGLDLPGSSNNNFRPRQRERSTLRSLLLHIVWAKFGVLQDTQANRLVVRRLVLDELVRRRLREVDIYLMSTSVVEQAFIPPVRMIRTRMAVNSIAIRARKEWRLRPSLWMHVKEKFQFWAPPCVPPAP